MAAPEFMREVFEKALALHLPDMFAIRNKYQDMFKRIILQDGTSFAVHDDLMFYFPGRFNENSPAALRDPHKLLPHIIHTLSDRPVSSTTELSTAKFALALADNIAYLY